MLTGKGRCKQAWALSKPRVSQSPGSRVTLQRTHTLPPAGEQSCLSALWSLPLAALALRAGDPTALLLASF